MKHQNRYTQEGLTQWIRRLIAENNLHDFYVCSPWIRLRDQALDEQHHECQDCKGMGRYEPATVAHHEKPVRKYPWLALSKENLTALCDSCHYKRHHKQVARWDDERW